MRITLLAPVALLAACTCEDLVHYGGGTFALTLAAADAPDTLLLDVETRGVTQQELRRWVLP